MASSAVQGVPIGEMNLGIPYSPRSRLSGDGACGTIADALTVPCGAGPIPAANAGVEMAYVKGLVYDSPKAGFPHVVVVFDDDGEVLVARSVPSVAAGDALLEEVLGDLQSKIDRERGDT